MGTDATMTTPAVETVPLGADARIVVARGELDFYSAPALRADLFDAVASSRAVVVDLLDVTFIDSTALGTLIGAGRRSADGSWLAIACVDPHVVRTLELTGVDRLVPVFASVAEAFAARAGGGDGGG